MHKFQPYKKEAWKRNYIVMLMMHQHHHHQAMRLRKMILNLRLTYTLALHCSRLAIDDVLYSKHEINSPTPNYKCIIAFRKWHRRQQYSSSSFCNWTQVSSTNVVQHFTLYNINTHCKHCMQYETIYEK